MKNAMTLRKVLLSVLAIGVMLAIAACPQQKSIADIQRDPGRYANDEVAIKGTVTESWGALGTGMYQVDDGSGKMWVLSSGYGVPSKGAKVGVAGTIQPTLSLGGRNFATVMRETKRRR